jgi:hypothetical protein
MECVHVLRGIKQQKHVIGVNAKQCIPLSLARTESRVNVIEHNGNMFQRTVHVAKNALKMCNQSKTLATGKY